MKQSVFFVSGNEAALAGHAAALIISEAWRAVSSRGRFTFALSGGRSPRMLYRKLSVGIEPGLMKRHGIPVAGKPGRNGLIRMPWQETLIFWVDERCVPPDHPESNYRMAKETLLDTPSIAENRIFRMPCGEYHPEKAAEAYEETVRRVLCCRNSWKSIEIPAFDLIVLGLGEDGHTASLFPGDSKALKELRRLVIAVEAPHARPPLPRLSMTLPLMNRTRTVLFYTEGEKRAKLAEAIVNNTAPAGLPAGMVKPASGNLYWFTVLPSAPKPSRDPTNPEDKHREFVRQRLL